MRAGVLDGHRVCVSWFHYWDFLEQFPQADANLLVADRLRRGPPPHHLLGRSRFD